MECLRDNFYDGKVLDGRYQTISPLNHGSFGMVFMARDLVTKELVAIKCLTKKSTTDDNNFAFAIDDKSEELACHSILGSHKNVVNLLHSFETDAHVYLVLEFCARGDLYEAIRTGCGPLETEHVREFMLQLIDAITYIHSKGIYHRDIKPENIFLTDDGTLKLGDFGLVTKETWSFETNVGSDRYMAPEQYDSAGAGYSPGQADIWAVGICLLNILFSRNPFTTPTESDPLFLDFSRDRQSLFDVFPTMSQDTFEIITHCMSLDPKKRSLSAAREAIQRAVSFTTFDESLDDFESARPAVAGTKREPLRTPSLQSLQAEQDSFPWAKALHGTPPLPIRQLSVIPDTESYDEDLFPSSEESNQDWFSVGGKTPSMGSVLTSSLGASMKSMAIRRPRKSINPPRAEHTSASGSLPITMSKPRPLPSMSTVFGRKDEMVSKSWSDLWDEEIEEEEEHEKRIKERQALNSRTWSHESTSEHVDAALGRLRLSEHQNAAESAKSMRPAATPRKMNDVDGDMVDGFFFQHSSPTRHASPPRYSPPSKRNTLAKWAALGDRRRAATSSSEKSPDVWRGRHNHYDFGKSTSGNTAHWFKGFGTGAWDCGKAHSPNVNAYSHQPRAKGCPWVRDRDHVYDKQHSRKDKTSDLGDLEWVGGWQDSLDLQL